MHSNRSDAITLAALRSTYLLASYLWTGRGRQEDYVYRKVFGKWAVGFWREGARRRLWGGRGISQCVFVTLHPLLVRQEGEWVTECANEVDIPKDERLTPTSDKEIRPFKLSAHLKEEGNRKKKKEWFWKRKKERGGKWRRRLAKNEKMEAVRQTLPRLQLTVPMPIKKGKVGLTFTTSGWVRPLTFARERDGLRNQKDHKVCRKVPAGSW